MMLVSIGTRSIGRFNPIMLPCIGISSIGRV